MSNLPSGRMKARRFHLGYDIPKPRPERGMVVGGGDQYLITRSNERSQCESTAFDKLKSKTGTWSS